MMRSHESNASKEEGEATMKFYIAGYSGLEPDDMDYKKLGGDEELYDLFPELKKVLNRYTIKNIDVRFSNGDRLRVYDICRGSSRGIGGTAGIYDSPQSIAAVCRA